MMTYHATSQRHQAHAMKIMESIGYPELILAAVCFVLLHYLTRNNNPINWPIVGMLPALIINLDRIHDWFTYLLSKNGCTFVFRGPWFSSMTHMVVTSDPANMRYIFNTNFSNYPKGTEFREFFDVLGDGIFNADYDSWKTQRKAAHYHVNQKIFQSFLEQTSHNKVNKGLVSVLEHVLEHNLVMDFQDLMKMYSFDTTLTLVAGIDPGCLSTELKHFPFIEAFDVLEEAIFYRHAKPMMFWKFQRWLGFGEEKKLLEAWKILDQFVDQCISRKREMHSVKLKNNEDIGNDLLASYMEAGDCSDKFVRDTIVNFMEAGRSTLTAALTWFFYLISENPRVEAKIIEEIKAKGNEKETDQGKKPRVFSAEELKGMVYLQGALYEVLRLYPSVPVEHKRPLKPDILPSGHKVDSESKIMPLFYAVGRMEEVWGKDCLEFKPERWISKDGQRIDYVPSYKFISFNSGPRSCIGKEIAFTQMRMVAATVLYNYHVEVVEGQSLSLKNSVILYLKHGMKVRIKRRI